MQVVWAFYKESFAMKMHLNGFLALYMFRAGALCALPTISACTYMQTADGAYAEGPYVVDSHVLYILLPLRS